METLGTEKPAMITVTVSFDETSQDMHVEGELGSQSLMMLQGKYVVVYIVRKEES